MTQLILAALRAVAKWNMREEEFQVISEFSANDVVSALGREAIERFVDVSGETQKDRLISLEGHCKSCIPGGIRSYKQNLSVTLGAAQKWGAAIFHRSSTFYTGGMTEACTTSGLKMEARDGRLLLVNPPF